MPGKAGQAPLPPWGNALAGATGAVLANAIVYPLDMYAKLSAVKKSRGACADSANQSQDSFTGPGKTQTDGSSPSYHQRCALHINPRCYPEDR